MVGKRGGGGSGRRGGQGRGREFLAGPNFSKWRCESPNSYFLVPITNKVRRGTSDFQSARGRDASASEREILALARLGVRSRRQRVTRGCLDRNDQTKESPVKYLEWLASLSQSPALASHRVRAPASQPASQLALRVPLLSTFAATYQPTPIPTCLLHIQLESLILSPSPAPLYCSLSLSFFLSFRTHAQKNTRIYIAQKNRLYRSQIQRRARARAQPS